LLRVVLILVLLIIVARMFWRVVDAAIAAASGEPPRKVKSGVKLERDPVCGTYVAPSSALSLTTGGTTRYFCSEKCRNEYIAR